MPDHAVIPAKEEQQHLARVRALIGEVETAITAIAENDLPRLQTALANQESLCCNLAATQWTPAAPVRLNQTAQSEASRTATETQEAYVALARLNRAYDELVKRSKKCTDLLIALYCGHGEGYGKPPAVGQPAQTLSCEV